MRAEAEIRKRLEEKQKLVNSLISSGDWLACITVGKVMLLKRYVIDVHHGDKEHPCTCTEEDMERLCDLLPDEELVRALVAPFIRSQIPLPKDAPIVIRGEAEGPGRGVR